MYTYYVYVIAFKADNENDFCRELSSTAHAASTYRTVWTGWEELVSSVICRLYSFSIYVLILFTVSPFFTTCLVYVQVVHWS